MKAECKFSGGGSASCCLLRGAVILRICREPGSVSEDPHVLCFQHRPGSLPVAVAVLGGLCCSAEQWNP